MKALAAKLLGVVILIASCSYPENSVSGDTDVFGNNAAANGSAQFKQVAVILKNRCVRCHRGFSRLEEHDWVNAGYVVAGDPAASNLFSRLKGANVAGPENMPVDDNALSASETETIRFWIAEVVTAGADEGNGGTDLTEEELTARRTAALAVVSARCLPCHATTKVAISSAHAGETVPAFGSFTHESQFLSAGLIVSGLPAASWLYDSLQVYGTIGVMPKNSSPLTTQEKDALRAWISGLP